MSSSNLTDDMEPTHSVDFASLTQQLQVVSEDMSPQEMQQCLAKWFRNLRRMARTPTDRQLKYHQIVTDYFRTIFLLHKMLLSTLPGNPAVASVMDNHPMEPSECTIHYVNKLASDFHNHPLSVLSKFSELVLLSYKATQTAIKLVQI